MKTILLLLITIFTNGLRSTAQSTGEFQIGFTNSIFMKNRFAGTDYTYEKGGEFSSLNVKCTNIAGLQMGYANSIGKSHWRMLLGLEKKWLTYKGTIFQNGYNPNSSKNNYEKIELKNQLNIVKVGIGYDLLLLKSKLAIRPNLNLMYRIYRDNEISQTKNLERYDKEIGDMGYKVDLSSENYTKEFTAEIGISMSYLIHEKIRLFTNFCYASPIQVEYNSFQETVVNKTFDPVLGIIHISSFGVFDGGWRIKTSNFNFGFGISYSI